MTKKGDRPEPVNLSDVQKNRIKADIFATFPTLKEYVDDIDFLISEYSKDRHFIRKLMEKAKNPVEALTQMANGGVKHLSKGDPEYQEYMDKMHKARADWEARQKEIAEQAEKELADKQKNVVIH